LVPRGGDGLALLAIGTDTADIREKYPGLARNVRSHVPGIGMRKQRLTGSLRDVGDPRFLGRGLRFNGNCPSGAHGRDEIGDEIHVLLDGYDHIAEDGGAARSGNHEKIREARRGEAEVSARAFTPLLRKAPVVASPYVDGEQGSRPRVEARGADDTVDRELRNARAQAMSCRFQDRRG